MPSFEDLGLREELLQRLEEEDLNAPTAMQEAVIPGLRRGGNLVARASSGSGRTLAYAVGVLDRFEPSDLDNEIVLRMLVIVPDGGEAERAARAMSPYANALGLPIAAPSAAWGTPVQEAGVFIGPAADLMSAVKSSTVKLDAVEAVVIDGAATIATLGDLEQVDGLLDLVPRDAQRVLISPSFPAQVEDLVDRRVKKALRYPSEPALPDRGPGAPVEGTVGYVLVGESLKLLTLAEQLRQKEAAVAPPIIFCRTDERAAELAEALSIRGFVVGPAGDLDADVAVAAGGVSLAELTDETDGDPGQTISYDVPTDARSLRARHGGDEDAVVLLEPRQLAHLHEIARQANFHARPTPLPRAVPAHAVALQTFRDDLREALQTEDLTAQLLVLAPLLEEYSAEEVAAAVTSRLRARRPQPEVSASTPDAGRTPPARPAPDRSAPAGPAPVTWARLFVGLGSRDDIGPGDLVGALAGEANIPGSRIGKIEIRDSFSIVEVQADVADKVIQAVNGTTMKGRSVRVDYDRGGPARRPPGRGGASPRRTTRKPREE